MTSGAADRFDLQLLQDNFAKCKLEDGIVVIDAYLDAYTELNKFVLKKRFHILSPIGSEIPC